jgi:alcohol dehydrogenase
MNLPKIYQFRMPKSILFGLGAAERLGERLKELGGKRSLIVTDRLLRPSAIDQIGKNLQRAGVDALVYDEVITEPTTDQVNKGTSIFRSEKCDSVVALGGGSCIDAGKGIALLGTNPREIAEYEGRGKRKGRIRG